jgi:choline dehydrogenase
MLGGSSNMNAQIHQWCHPADFDGWADCGAKGWSWTDVRPTFEAQETWTGVANPPGRGRGGPMIVSPLAHPHRLSRAFVASALATLPRTSSQQYNGDAYEGAWLCELAHKGGQRFSAYDAHLLPARRRPNLEVVTNAQVMRIVIESDRVAGVEARCDGQTLFFACAKGVIAAAGSFGTPHLLMHSGIGPAEHLAGFGIGLVRDAPEVGAGLQDHPLVPVLFRAVGTDTFKKAQSLTNLLRYLLFKRGMLASNAVEAMAFVRTGLAAGDAPDLELIFVPFEWRAQGLESPKIHAYGIAPAVVRPRSRGSVRLRGPDPLTPPAIDFNLLGDPDGRDAKVLTAGIHLARRITSVGPLAAEAKNEADPGAAVQSEQDLRSWMDERIQTVYHPTSTCRMGSDENSIVDPQLRVRGIKGLWIADASVMPAVPRGHPNAVVAMIANRAAKMIDQADLQDRTMPARPPAAQVS